MVLEFVLFLAWVLGAAGQTLIEDEGTIVAAWQEGRSPSNRAGTVTAANGEIKLDLDAPNIGDSYIYLLYDSSQKSAVGAGKNFTFLGEVTAASRSDGSAHGGIRVVFDNGGEMQVRIGNAWAGSRSVQYYVSGFASGNGSWQTSIGENDLPKNLWVERSNGDTVNMYCGTTLLASRTNSAGLSNVRIFVFGNACNEGYAKFTYAILYGDEGESESYDADDGGYAEPPYEDDYDNGPEWSSIPPGETSSPEDFGISGDTALPVYIMNTYDWSQFELADTPIRSIASPSTPSVPGFGDTGFFDVYTGWADPLAGSTDYGTDSSGLVIALSGVNAEWQDVSFDQVVSQYPAVASLRTSLRSFVVFIVSVLLCWACVQRVYELGE
jgi:hypothetical protein